MPRCKAASLVSPSGRKPLGTSCLDEILKNKIHYRRRGIEDRGYLLKFFHDRASCHGGEEVHLGVEFPAHSLGSFECIIE